jgi:hypothetical protein
MINRAEYIEASILAKIFTNDCRVIFVRVFDTDFSDESHKRFFSICKSHYFAYGEITKSILQDKAKIGNIFDYGTIDMYINGVDSESIDALILELKDFSRKRDQEKVLAEALKMTRDVTVTSNDITSKIYNNTRKWSDNLEAKSHTMNEIAQELASGIIGERLKIGQPDMDMLYADGGSHKRTTEVCVAYSKTGKSNYACYRTALYLKQGYKGAYITFEGGREMIYGFMKPHIESSDSLFIIDSCRDLDQTIAKIWELKIVHDIDFVVVDYIQRIPVSGIPYHQELERIVTVSPALTDICHRENIFGLFLSQPNRPPQNTIGWKNFPTTDSIYGSTQIEKDAYLISALFRPSLIRGLTFRNTTLKTDAVQMYDGTLAPYHTVSLRVLKQRAGVVQTKTINMVHSDEGLKIPINHFRYDNNGNWQQTL